VKAAGDTPADPAPVVVLEAPAANPEGMKEAAMAAYPAALEATTGCGPRLEQSAGNSFRLTINPTLCGPAAVRRT
jgi:hypothetical protein